MEAARVYSAPRRRIGSLFLLMVSRCRSCRSRIYLSPWLARERSYHDLDAVAQGTAPALGGLADVAGGWWRLQFADPGQRGGARQERQSVRRVPDLRRVDGPGWSDGAESSAGGN